MEFIKRDTYLNELKESVGNKLVKIITGPRRCGKSFLLFSIFRNYLLNQGVQENHIIELKLDQLSNSACRNVFAFLAYFKQRYAQDGKTWFFLIDELQFVAPMDNPNVQGQKVTFYDALNEMMDFPNVEIFVTGSNSHLLSSDIATEFRGRDCQIRMHPLSFSEYLACFPSEKNELNLFRDYLFYGGLPGRLEYKEDFRKRNYLKSVFESAYLKDVIDRHSLRGSASLDNLTQVIATSVGSLINPTKLSNTFRSKENLTLSPQTIQSYLTYLEDAFLLSKVQRYDLKGKNVIGGNAKYYFEDLGLRYAASGFVGGDILPRLMENAIYNELIIQNYQVDVGVIIKNELLNGKQTKIQREVDFVASKQGKKYYIQSAYLMPSLEKQEQEKKSLLSIADGFKKIVISMEAAGTSQDEDGVYHIGVLDFFLHPNALESI